MAVTTGTFLMADRLAAGRLAAILAEKRVTGKGFERIARELYAEHGIHVSGQTVLNWCDLLAIPNPKDEPKAVGE